MTIKIKDFELKKGDYFAQEANQALFSIKEIMKDEVWLIFYDLDANYSYEMEPYTLKEFEFEFTNIAAISPAVFKSLTQDQTPLLEKEIEQLATKLKEALHLKSFDLAEMLLIDYFKKVVLVQPSKLLDYFEFRSQIKLKKYKPCICYQDIDAIRLKAFYGKLPTHLWAILEKHIKARMPKIKNQSHYEADPNDKALQNLVSPFVSTDNLRVAMMGVHFNAHRTVATDAYNLLYLPKGNKDKTGVYCMTRKCFKENEQEVKVTVKFPDVSVILPTQDNEFETYDIDLIFFRTLIKNLDTAGLKDNHQKLAINFRYGSKGFIGFDCNKTLIHAIEALLKLGCSTAKLWIQGSNKAMILSGADATKNDLVAGRVPFVLSMPVHLGNDIKEFKASIGYGEVVYNLDKQSFIFHGQKVTPYTHLNEAAETTKFQNKQSIAKAQAQRIRILKLKKLATTAA